MTESEKRFRQILEQVLAQTAILVVRSLDDAVAQISRVLERYFSNSNSVNPWAGNSISKKRIEEIISQYVGKIVRLTENQIRNIWLATEELNDQSVIKKLLEATGTTIVIAKLYKYLNRIIPEGIDPKARISISKETIENVIKSPRNTQALETFLNRKVNGFTLSKRVWNLADETVQPLIESYLTQGIEKGTSAQEIARNLKQYLLEPDRLFRRVRNKANGKFRLSTAAEQYNPGQGVYRSSYMNAKRLAVSEVNFAYRSADHERWKNLDFIRGIKVSLSSSHSSRVPNGDICDQLQGQYPKDFFFTGWHPFCLCHATAILLPEEDFIKQINDEPFEINSVDLPENFSRYLNENKERIDGWKNKPYWMRYNPRFTGNNPN